MKDGRLPTLSPTETKLPARGKVQKLGVPISLCRRLEMRQGFFGMGGRGFRISLFTSINGRVEMHNALLCMWIVLFGLGRLSMLEGGLGMGHEDVGMSLLAMRDGLFRMLNGLGHVILCEDKTRRHQGRGSNAKTQCENSSVHGSSSLFPFRSHEGLGTPIFSAATEIFQQFAETPPTVGIRA